MPFNTILSFRLYNQYGSLDNSKPFQPFGVQPDKGSYLIIGSNEWLNKGTIDIVLKIFWQAEPPKNFTDYYEGYSNALFTNHSFQLNFSILHNGNWYLLNTEPVSLFAEDENSGDVLPSSAFYLSVDKELLLSDSLLNNMIPLFNQNTKEGYIKAELVSPEYGFGASLYGNSLSLIVLENTKGNNLKLPNSPYTPLASRVEIGFINPTES
jgi:hypothetical protein